MSEDQETVEGELIPSAKQQLVATEPNVQMDMMAAALGGQSAIEVNNFDGDAVRKWELSSMCTAGETIPSDDSVGNVIAVKYIYMHGVTLDGPTAGEKRDCVRTVLIDDKNDCYSFVSAGVALEAFKLLRLFQCKPFVPARQVKVVRKKTSKGRNLITLVPVPTAS